MRLNTTKVLIFEHFTYLSNFSRLQNENETAYTSRSECSFLITHAIMATFYGIIGKLVSITKSRKSHVKASFISTHSEYFTISYLWYTICTYAEEEWYGIGSKSSGSLLLSVLNHLVFSPAFYPFHFVLVQHRMETRYCSLLSLWHWVIF